MSKKSEPDKPAQKPVTEIAFLLDRSRSRQGYIAAAIGGFNYFLADQQQVEGLACLTLVLCAFSILLPAVPSGFLRLRLAPIAPPTVFHAVSRRVPFGGKILKIRKVRNNRVLDPA